MPPWWMCVILYNTCETGHIESSILLFLSTSCFFLFWAFFLQFAPFASVIPPLLPPPSWPPAPSVAVVVPPPSPASSAGYLPLFPPVQIQEDCQWELLSS